jgi:hypothetical protein
MVVNPEPIPRDDGGTDFRMSECSAACYAVNAQGMSVEIPCPFLKVVIGDYPLRCGDPAMKEILNGIPI